MFTTPTAAGDSLEWSDLPRLLPDPDDANAAWLLTVTTDAGVQGHSITFTYTPAALKPVAAGVEVDAGIVERYDLAVIVEGEDGHLRLVGTLDDGARRAWQVVNRHGRVRAQEVEVELGAPAETASRALDDLSARRLVMRRDDGYVSLAHAV